MGTILGSFDTLAELEAAVPNPNPGDMYLIGTNLYVWDAIHNQWDNIGNIQGPQGPTGITRSNAFRVTFSGNVHSVSGTISGGADYAEMFEWLDGNIDNEDRRGYFVTLVNIN